MARHKLLIYPYLIILAQCFLGVCSQNVDALENEKEFTKEELEIIENLDFLDNIELLEEELSFLEDYSDIERSEYIGEEDE